MGNLQSSPHSPLRSASFYTQAESFLQISARKAMKPAVGKIDGNDITCNGKMAEDDMSFKKADLCRNHGNGLEVVCVEKYYQEASKDLPKPDFVVMFSPGFPQLARRSWDQVLRPLLDSKVPIMVSDIMRDDQVKRPDDIYDASGSALPAPGSEWRISEMVGEGALTLGAMTAYEAHEVGAFRNPFPIYIGERGQGGTTAKCMIVQLFQGRTPNAKPWEVPSTTAMSSLKAFVEGIDWVGALDDDEENAAEVKMSFLFPCSTAYDKAMWMHYRKRVQKKVARMSRRGQIKRSWKPTLEKLGLMGNKRRETPWTVKEWAFIITKLKFSMF